MKFGFVVALTLTAAVLMAAAGNPAEAGLPGRVLIVAAFTCWALAVALVVVPALTSGMRGLSSEWRALLREGIDNETARLNHRR